MARKQAKAGGETGINGELYKGGQFLPDYQDRAKGSTKTKPRRRRKVEIEPYVWVEDQGLDSLWQTWGFFWGYDRATRRVYVHGDDFPWHNYDWQERRAGAADAARRYNAGERYLTPEEQERREQEITASRAGCT